MHFSVPASTPAAEPRFNYCVLFYLDWMYIQGCIICMNCSHVIFLSKSETIVPNTL